MTHLGLILLLLGQLGTDLLSTESAMRLEEGETKNYSEDFHANELVFINKSLPNEDEVVAVPEKFLAAKQPITHPQLPFTVKVKDYWPNSYLTNFGPFIADALAKEGFVRNSADQGIGPKVMVQPMPVVTAMDSRNIPSAVIEVSAGGAVKGSWLVSSQTSARQTVEHDGKTWELALRFQRHYKPYSFTLLDFTHERYPGTDLPKDFRSRVRVVNPSKNEDREVEIFMNNPLRYDGMAFYQASFEPGDTVTVLQVVKNPGWLTPYFACLLVGLGLTVQFMIHLVEFIRKRKTPATAAAATASTAKAKNNQPRKNAEVAQK
jgi:hypothetical protein